MITYRATQAPAPVPLPARGFLHGLCCELFVRTIRLTPGAELIPLRWISIDYFPDAIHLAELFRLGESSSNP